jgi:hypothetical protein
MEAGCTPTAPAVGIAAAGLVGQLRGKKNLTRLMQNSVAVFDRLEEETGQAIAWKKVGSLRLAGSRDRWSEIRGEGGDAVANDASRLVDASGNQRAAWWTQGWRGFTDSPVIGQGAGGFRLVHLQERRNDNDRLLTNEPHGVVVRFLSGTGIVGLLLFATLVGAVVWGVLRSMVRHPRPETALPLAMLAAVGMPTLKRGIVSLIDWFAVTSFTLFGIVIWAYWIALMTGYPPRMAYRASQIAPGYTPEWVVVEIVLGGLATLAWLALVRWRISRQPRMIWRAMVLSCGGVVLAWFLLMTLWLPVFNERNTYRDVATRLATAFDGGNACVATQDLGRAPRASFHYFARMNFAARGEQCDWLLVQDDGPLARTVPSPVPGWTLLWQGQRRSDRDERFRLYRREDPRTQPGAR